MTLVLKILTTIFAIMFVGTGVRWLVDPAGVAPMFGLTLGQGVGLSSQVGDMAGFFLTLGACALLGLITGVRTWFFPAMMLLGITATGRVVAWLVHDATLATDMIGLEIIAALVFWLTSRKVASAE